MKRFFENIIGVVIKPKDTIKRILENKEHKETLPISIIVGMTFWLFQLQATNFGEDYGVFASFLGAFVVGGVVGIASLYLFAFIIRFVSKKSRGAEMDANDLRTAIAWGSTPMFLLLIFFVISTIIHKQVAFTMTVDNGFTSTLRLAINIITGITVYRAASVVMHPEEKSTIGIQRVSGKKKRKKKK